MDVSARWINDYLDPPATPEEQADLLTRAGFPLEGGETVEDGDTRQDFEMTSNRGDCVCHLGLAREIAALSGRTLRVPVGDPVASGPPVAEQVSLENREPERCPLYTARVIRGIAVGPSPDWLATRLRARGDIPRNNVVDATNFVLFEMGQPTHVFDLAKLTGPEIVVRMAGDRERFLPIGEAAAEVALSAEDLVIADAENAVAIAGVKGGALSAVTNATTDILIEAATFDAVSVRNTSRRLNIASDSSYRFERGVHPGLIEAAARRLTQLICELCGGELCEGVLTAGAEIPEPRVVTMRPDRCRAILGVEIPDERMLDGLARLGFDPKFDNGLVRCTVPVHRLDIDREIDLIEEVARMHGLDRITVAEMLSVRVAPPQPRALARRAVSDALVGMDFVETVSHSLVSESAAAAFLPAGTAAIRVEDDRAGGEPMLRPSLLPSLLRVWAHNRDHGAEHLRLFESAAVYRRRADGGHHEAVVLSLLGDMTTPEDGLRPLRGVVERLIGVVCGPAAELTVTTAGAPAWLTPGGGCHLDGEPLGWIGAIAPGVARQWGLDERLLAAELELPRLYDVYPPETEAHSLPAYPPIERDVTADVAESVTWQQVRAAVSGLGLEDLEALDFVTVYRGAPLPPDRKSLTLRARFRSASRTLTRDEVEPQVAAIVESLGTELGAAIRS